MPAATHFFMYLPGLPAPVTTTGIFSSMTRSETSSAKGLISMMLTPKALSVSWRALWISFIAAMMPNPPALLTAAASEASAIQAMPPWKMGY